MKIDEIDEARLYENIMRVVGLSGKTGPIRYSSEDDAAFRHHVTKQITERDLQYTDLLMHFVQLTKTRHWIKEFFKWFFCFILLLSLVAMIKKVDMIITPFLTSASLKEFYDAMPVLISAFVSLASVLIAIPLIITKYLFSTEEDDYITQIIMHTQSHDMSGREWSTHSKESKQSEPDKCSKDL